MTTQTFALTGRINLSIRAGHGSVEVRTAEDLTEAVVELTAGSGSEDLAQRMTVELSGPTLTVHAPRQGGLADLVTPWRPRWHEGLAIVVTVPTGTAVKIATFTASITVHGRTGGADIATGSGAIRVEEVDGDLLLRYGSSETSVARVTGSVTARSGAGDAHFGEILGDLLSGCGTGRLEADVVRGAVKSRAGSGDALLGAVYGDVDIASGSGAVSVGLPAGISARLDVTTGSGRVSSELPIEDAPAERRAAITVRARTGNGDVRLFRAA